MSDSVRPRRWQPTRLLRPWNSPGKSTGVGCYCLLQCIKVKSESEVAQSCLTLCDLMDYTVHGILPARILVWVAVPFSRGSSQPRESNPGLPHCRRILNQLSHQESPTSPHSRLLTSPFCPSLSQLPSISCQISLNKAERGMMGFRSPEHGYSSKA